MTVFRWIGYVLLYLTMLPLSSIAAFIVPLFTRYMPPDLPSYTWGGWFGTYDNPPQGDEGFISKRAPYPSRLTGWRGYVNRVQWMRRNRLYGLKRWLSVDWQRSVKLWGDPDISDKYRIAGWLYASHPKAFEFYAVLPYSKRRCLRVRLGWKIKGRKFTQRGDFAPLVFTVNPFDSFGG